MPEGGAWDSKYIEDSNLYAQMHGTSKPFNMAEGRREDLARESNIDETVELITDWETSVGLPDECFGAVDDIVQRRELVKERIRKLPIVTLEQQQALIDDIFPDLGIKLYPGSEFFSFEYTFEPMYFLGNVSARFIIVALIPPQAPFFEYEFEFPFMGGVNTTQLKCVLDRISPGNVLPLILQGTLVESEEIEGVTA